MSSPRQNAITLVLCGLVACNARTRRTPDDTLVMVIETKMTTSDPRYALTNYDGKLAKLVAPGLTSVDTPTAEARLELASKIDRIDDVTMEVTLRDDIRFSDGQPVTADDVVRTYQTVMADECNSLYQRAFRERFTSIEARGDKQIRFHLKEPLGTFVTDVDFGIISFHGVPAGQCSPPIVRGAGPYVVRSLTSTGATLDANPYSWTPPKLPHVEIKFVSDASARILMLVGGSADLVQNAVRVDLVEDVLRRPRVQLQSGPSVLLTYMMLNNEDPALRDVRVRQAIALAIDRPAIIAAKFGGRAVLATGLLPPTHWAYNPDVARWDHDLARAKQLLDEAGLRPDRNGVRLHLVYKTSADAFRVAIARVLVAQLAQVGIDVELRSFEFATFFADVKKGNYQLATIQSPEITEPDFYLWFFLSTRIPDAKDPDGGNRARYRNPEIDRLTWAGRREVDLTKRKPFYMEAQRIIAQDVPIIPLWHEDNVVLSNVDVQGYTIVPNARLIGLVQATKTH
ncbi:MAG: extracellular solute-binding protein family 5 [Myxococcales bacterium]|nr:extracellular solute-binding protein family 5 [Myxococcales bacterium]